MFQGRDTVINVFGRTSSDRGPLFDFSVLWLNLASEARPINSAPLPVALFDSQPVGGCQGRRAAKGGGGVGSWRIRGSSLEAMHRVELASRSNLLKCDRGAERGRTSQGQVSG